ncbi:amidase family protein [Nocardia gipuzkoensis]|uniref:amidase family protein n=1 Tax=Nocardia gipuzkoensis TaxID=2749991 RepID=UPI003EDF1E9E
MRKPCCVPRFIPFTPPFNTVRYPAMSIPAGHSDDGLPIGIQLAAAPGGESMLFGVAAQLEEIRPWPRHAALDHAAPQEPPNAARPWTSDPYPARGHRVGVSVACRVSAKGTGGLPSKRARVASVDAK